MDQKELESYIRSLQKAVAEKSPDVMSILEKLKKEVVATEELLRSTKAGLVVAKQRANRDPSIAKLASEIVQKWKKTVEAEKAKRAKMSTPSSASPPKVEKASSSAEPEKGFVGDSSKRRWETDKVDVKRTGIPTRDNCIGLMYNGLAFKSTESPSTVLIKAVEVEAAAADAYSGDTPEYRAKMRSLYQNLKNLTNRELGTKVLSGEVPASRFVVMSHDELKSAQQKQQDAKLMSENMKNAQVPMAERSISDALKCGKCGQKKVSYSQAQTRSADEPMTTFCECTVCGNRWKFS
ncbi:transcription elongation factor S-II [Phlyctema vagabunda]|uniref:Transcription elongation factor n=1 Tax=Phlyctema vagabunda TaxID=108571 RepID=A0ABR4PFU6_9HELO